MTPKIDTKIWLFIYFQYINNFLSSLFKSRSSNIKKNEKKNSQEYTTRKKYKPIKYNKNYIK